MTTRKAVAKKAPTAVATVNYESDANAGFEDADSASYAIPFLAILQSGSPQCKKSDGAYIEGAEEGALFNTVNERIFDGGEGLIVVPCHFKRSFIEWQPRESGGGFVKEHSAAEGAILLGDTHRDDKGHDVLPNGNLLVDTRTHYVLAGDDLSPAVVSMSSTQIKKSRKWMTIMQNLKLARADGTQFTPPMYSHLYQVTTIPESNDQGSWFGWKIVNAGIVQDENINKQAKEFRAAILSGEAKEQPKGDTEEKEDGTPF